MKTRATVTLLVLLAAGPAAAAEFTRGPWLQDVTTDSIKVMWEAAEEEPSGTSVSWGLTPAHELGTQSATFETVNGLPVYTVHIAGLAEGTIHHYTVTMGTSSTLDATFRTAPAAGETGFRFYALGDSRSNPSAWGAICRQIHDDMTEHPAHHQSFIVNTGDIAEDGSLYGEWDQLWPPCLATLREMPLYVSFGNHEDRGTTESDAYLYGYFAFPHTRSGSTDEKWFSVEYGNVHLAFIDIYADEGVSSGPQHDWLVSDLEAASTDPLVDWIVGSMHFTPWSLGEHDEADAADIRDSLHPVFRDAGTDLVLGGHNHIYARYAPVDGVTYLTTGGGGASLHTDTYTGWSGATLEHYAGVYHHCVVDVEQDVIAIRAIDLEGDVFDWVTLGGTDTNRPPIAVAGPDQAGTTSDTFTLDGTASEDPEGASLTHSWTQVSGPAATLSGADTASPTFTPSSTGRHVFELRVNDGTNASAPDFAAVDVYTGILTLSPVADTYVDRSSPTTNFGTSDTLQLDLGPEYNPDDTQHSYLRFDVAGIVGRVVSAILGLHTLNAGSSVLVHTSSDVTWLETSPTWDAPLPADGPLAGTLHAPTQDARAEVDVTPVVRADGPLTFILLPTGTDGTDFSSREGSHPPELVVAYTDEPATEEPACSIAADRTDVLEGGSVSFTATATPAAGRTIESHEWDFDHDLYSFDVQATGAEATHVFPDPGVFLTAFRATDDAGLSCLSTIRIQVTAIPEPLPEERPEPSGRGKGCSCTIVW